METKAKALSLFLLLTIVSCCLSQPYARDAYARDANGRPERGGPVRLQQDEAQWWEADLVLYLDDDVTKFLDAGGNPADDGEAVQTWVDSGPNGYDATAPATSNRPIRSATKLLFDGGDDILDAGAIAYSSYTELTVWVVANVSNLAGDKTLIGYGDNSAGRKSWFIAFTAAELFAVLISTDGNLYQKYYESPSGYTNSEHSFAFTFSSGALSLYVDGVDIGATPVDDLDCPSFFNSSDETTIGAFYIADIVGQTWPSTISQAIIWNKALTPAEVLQLETDIR